MSRPCPSQQPPRPRDMDLYCHTFDFIASTPARLGRQGASELQRITGHA